VGVAAPNWPPPSLPVKKRRITMTTEISVIGIFSLMFIGVVIGILVGSVISDMLWKKAIGKALSPGWANKIEKKRNGWE
jgi:uncharacterized protein YqgC (DUF456 family)